jgi:HAD superfamily hydrolase (TIGR01490 family)
VKYSGDEVQKHRGDELEEITYAAPRGAGGAAFFDIDGTLLAKPSLERRLFWVLRRQGKIPLRNCFSWLAETAWAGLREPGRLRAATLTNKSYLRGVRAEIPAAVNFADDNSKNWLPEFFPAAIQRVWWHALRGDAIVLVSGTIAPLADMVKFALERELLWRGVDHRIFVLATQLNMSADCWTGEVFGSAIFGEAKAIAIKEFARTQNISLERCSAYGDSSQDRWMLAAVGHSFAVNPTRRMQRIARSRGWQILHWTNSLVRTASEQRGRERNLRLKREAAR